MEANGQVVAPARFFPKESASGTHCIGEWVGPATGMEAVMKRKIPFIAPVGNRTPVIKPKA
jgi:hypothetical protein